MIKIVDDFLCFFTISISYAAEDFQQGVRDLDIHSDMGSELVNEI
jgi:hypothetical protein